MVGDHLGTALLEPSSAGNVTWKGEFAPFRQELSDPTTTVNRYKFTGKERDTESGLDYFGARYYGSSMGRWMSPDWANDPDPVPWADLSDPQTLNLYVYARNNPFRFRDEDGHKLVCTSSSSQDADGTVHVNVVCHEEPDPPAPKLLMAGALALAPESGGTSLLLGGALIGAAICYQTNCLQPLVNLFSKPAQPTTPTAATQPTAKEKVPKANVSGKEGSKDVPQWAKGNKPKVGESGKDFADRLLKDKYGDGNYPKGPGSEFNKIQKWGDRSFEDPPATGK